jgi:hypothetical protein
MACDGTQRRSAAVSRSGGAPVLGRRRGEDEKVQRDVAELLVGLARLEGQRKRQIEGRQRRARVDRRRGPAAAQNRAMRSRLGFAVARRAAL